MENTTDNNYPATLADLIEAMQDPSGRYKHLQIFFYRNKSSLDLGFGQKYLIVNRIGFDLYELTGVDYHSGVIKMLFNNPSNGNSAEINLNINDEHPEHFLICWNDIKNMVYAEQTHNSVDADLLELDAE